MEGSVTKWVRTVTFLVDYIAPISGDVVKKNQAYQPISPHKKCYSPHPFRYTSDDL